MPTKGYRTTAERHAAGYPVRSGLLALANAEAAPERPNQMSFAEQFVEALNEHIDARCSYNESRRGANAEYTNPDEMNKTEARLQGLVEKVRFAL